ncbi:MAG: asparagine synthase-related protein [bacterium]
MSEPETTPPRPPDAPTGSAGRAKPAGRGLSLLSGGLDSTLAICVLRAQGLHVEAVVFESPFFSSRNARKAAEQIGVRLHVLDFTADIVALVQHPPHGFGGAMNPCIDCHAGMINRAGAQMTDLGFDFLATGEVLNQRPMSQNRRSLQIVSSDCGYADRLVRPLSAQLLDPTEPERSGLIDRSRLLALNGRSRQAQIELAHQYGIREYPTPAGGCLLTENGFCRRLQDLLTHEGVAERRLLFLLRTGRHLRLPGGTKCIVGRNHADNETLEAGATPADVLVQPVNVPGPTLLLPGRAPAEDVELACGVCAGYADKRGDAAVTRVRVARGAQAEERDAFPLPRSAFEGWIL